MKLKYVDNLLKHKKSDIAFLSSSSYEIDSMIDPFVSFYFGNQKGYINHYTQRCVMTKINSNTYIYSRGAYRVSGTIVKYGNKWCYKHDNEVIFSVRKEITQIDTSEELLKPLRKVYNVAFQDETELTEELLKEMKQLIEDNKAVFLINNREQWYKYKEAAQNSYENLGESYIDIQCDGIKHAPELMGFGLLRGNLLEEGVASNSLYTLRQGYVERVGDEIWVLNRCDNSEEYNIIRDLSYNIIDNTFTRAKIFFFRDKLTKEAKSLTYMRMHNNIKNEITDVFIINTHRIRDDYIWEPIKRQGHIYEFKDIPENLRYMALKLIWITPLKSLITSSDVQDVKSEDVDKTFDIMGYREISKASRKLKCSYVSDKYTVYRETWAASNRSKVVKKEKMKDLIPLRLDKDHTGYNAHALDYVIENYKYELEINEETQYNIFVNSVGQKI